MGNLIQIVKPAIITSIQDTGRVGYRNLAIPRSGCIDAYSQRLANYLVHNSPEKPVVEFIGGTLVIKALENILIGISGVEIKIEVDDDELASNHTIKLEKGQILKATSDLGYLAINGGWNGTSHFNSISTYPLARLGGLNGSYLQKDDILFGAPIKSKALYFDPELYPKKGKLIRIIKGPEFNDGMDELENFEWEVQSNSNRMGIRLKSLFRANLNSISPVPVYPGTIQMTPDNTLIALLRDGQTTGGYPRIGQILKADLPRMARAITGGTLKFNFVKIEEAREIYDRQQTFIERALKID